MSQEIEVLKALLIRAKTNLTGMAGTLEAMDEYGDMEAELDGVHELVDEIDDALSPAEEDEEE